MKAEFCGDTQIDVVMLDDGELQPYITSQFPAFVVDEPDDSQRALPSWYPVHMQPASDAEEATTELIIKLAVGIAITMILGTGLLGFVWASSAPSKGNCLKIVNSSADIYTSVTGNQIVDSLQSEDTYEVINYGTGRYQIEEGWVYRASVKTEQISCSEWEY